MWFRASDIGRFVADGPTAAQREARIAELEARLAAEERAFALERLATAGVDAAKRQGPMWTRAAPRRRSSPARGKPSGNAVAAKSGFWRILPIGSFSRAVCRRAVYYNGLLALPEADEAAGVESSTA